MTGGSIWDSLWSLRDAHLGPFLRFCVVGVLNTLVHLVAFYLQADLLHWEHNLAATLSFLLAAANGYALNHVWTFRMSESWKIGGLLGYIMVNLVGLGINVGALNLVLLLYDPPLKLIAQLPGIPIAMIVNFLLSRYLVFRKPVAGRSQ